MTQPRSYLFVPATRPDRVGKALASGADAVIVDLEDAVGEDRKDEARSNLGRLEVDTPVPALVRVNAEATPHHRADLEAVAAAPWVSGVVVPKAESAAGVAAVASTLGDRVEILALVESARGVAAADEIAASGVARLLLGGVDYVADIGPFAGPEALAYPRHRLAVASRVAGLPAPVDSPTLATSDVAAVEGDARAAAALGFGAKLCIHPAQVPVVNRVFSPSAEQVAWARAVLDAAEATGGDAFTLDGRLVDEPVLVRARRFLEHAGVDSTQP